MFDCLIVNLAAICAHFCETDSFLALRKINKHWLHQVFSQSFTFKHFTLNDEWRARRSILISHKEWREDGCIFRHLSSFKLSTLNPNDTKNVLQRFFHLTTLSIESHWKTAHRLHRHQLPYSIVNLSVHLPDLEMIEHYDWYQHSHVLESLTLSFDSSVNDRELLFVILYDELSHLRALKFLSLNSQAFEGTDLDTISHQLGNLLRSFPVLIQFKWNVSCTVAMIKAIQNEAGPCCTLKLVGLNTPEWHKEMKEYLESNQTAAQNLQISMHWLNCADFQHLIDSCYLIRNTAVNFADTRPFAPKLFLAPQEWCRFAKCPKLSQIILHWIKPFPLRVEHLQQLLPICKQLRIFKMHHIIASRATFEVLSSWIRTHMIHLEHAEPLQKVMFISESEERYFRSIAA